MVFSEDLHFDRNTHELIVDEHDGNLAHVATESGGKGEADEKMQGEKMEQVV